MRSTTPSAEVARRRRRGGRPSSWRMRRRARPEASAENRRRQFLPDTRSSRYVESRAPSAGYRPALVAAETTQKLERTRFRLD
jgi:hypothetical protein